MQTNESAKDLALTTWITVYAQASILLECYLLKIVPANKPAYTNLYLLLVWHATAICLYKHAKLRQQRV